MKKTLVALSVLMAATSVQAIELYNNAGVTVDLKGDVEVRYKKGTAKDAELKQEIDDADFGFDTRYAINDDLQIGAYLEFSGDNNDRATDKTSVGNVYMGFYSKELGSIKFGKLDTQMDDAGVGSDFLFGIRSFVDDADFGGEEAIRYDLDKGNFYGGLGLIQDKHNAQSFGENGNYFDLKLGYRVADFDFTLFYAQAELRKAMDKDVNLLGLEGRYTGVENLKLELGYYDNTTDDNTAKTSNEEDTIALAADYTMDKTTFAAGYSMTNVKGGTDFNNWFLNAGYAIAPNTTAYVEIGGTDKDNTELGYGFGLKASF
ncbi:porin [Vibrio vulnificus]|uniref:porin n=1 Tax=Vibrio vulnificus TaxID=672 RepID=UPI001A1C1A35|nr:porin [Vibrio vulnificus]